MAPWSNLNVPDRSRLVVHSSRATSSGPTRGPKPDAEASW